MVLQPLSHAFCVFDSCGNLVCGFFSVLGSFSDHSFSHSMNTHELNMRFHLFDQFLDSFSCGLGRDHGHAPRASFVGPRLCSCVCLIIVACFIIALSCFLCG
jgi:hypothetical protein